MIPAAVQATQAVADTINGYAPPPYTVSPVGTGFTVYRGARSIPLATLSYTGPDSVPGIVAALWRMASSGAGVTNVSNVANITNLNTEAVEQAKVRGDALEILGWNPAAGLEPTSWVRSYINIEQIKHREAQDGVTAAQAKVSTLEADVQRWADQAQKFQDQRNDATRDARNCGDALKVLGWDGDEHPEAWAPRRRAQMDACGNKITTLEERVGALLAGLWKLGYHPQMDLDSWTAARVKDRDAGEAAVREVARLNSFLDEVDAALPEGPETRAERIRNLVAELGHQRDRAAKGQSDIAVITAAYFESGFGPSPTTPEAVAETIRRITAERTALRASGNAWGDALQSLGWDGTGDPSEWATHSRNAIADMGRELEAARATASALPGDAESRKAWRLALDKLAAALALSGSGSATHVIDQATDAIQGLRGKLDARVGEVGRLHEALGVSFRDGFQAMLARAAGLRSLRVQVVAALGLHAASDDVILLDVGWLRDGASEVAEVRARLLGALGLTAMGTERATVDLLRELIESRDAARANAIDGGAWRQFVCDIVTLTGARHMTTHAGVMLDAIKRWHAAYMDAAKARDAKPATDTPADYLQKAIDFIERHDGWTLRPGQDLHGWIVRARDLLFGARPWIGIDPAAGKDSAVTMVMVAFNGEEWQQAPDATPAPAETPIPRWNTVDIAARWPKAKSIVVLDPHTLVSGSVMGLSAGMTISNAHGRTYSPLQESADVLVQVQKDGSLMVHRDRHGSAGVLRWTGITWMSKKGRAKTCRIEGLHVAATLPQLADAEGKAPGDVTVIKVPAGAALPEKLRGRIYRGGDGLAFHVGSGRVVRGAVARIDHIEGALLLFVPA